MRERERGRFSSLSFVFSSCFFFFPFPPLFFFPPFEIEKQHPLCYLQPFLYVFVSSANFNERRRGAERGGGGVQRARRRKTKKKPLERPLPSKGKKNKKNSAHNFSKEKKKGRSFGLSFPRSLLMRFALSGSVPRLRTPLHTQRPVLRTRPSYLLVSFSKTRAMTTMAARKGAESCFAFIDGLHVLFEASKAKGMLWH